MNKIATVLTSSAGMDLVRSVLALCQKHSICLSQTRIGRVRTITRGWEPAVVIVQEFTAVAEAIERDVLDRLPGIAVRHVQGTPTEGTVQSYVRGTLYKYGTEPSRMGQTFQFNGNTLHVQV